MRRGKVIFIKTLIPGIVKQTIDINCDLGEGMANDEALMKFISSANIACGKHAGSADFAKRIIDLCLQSNVAIGAHPSFDDPHNFGRTEMKIPDDELYDLILSQIQWLDEHARLAGTNLVHVKPHGALYNLASRDAQIAAVIVEAIVDYNEQLVLFGLSGSHLINEGKKAGLKIANEVFADRTYQDNGSLTPRSQPEAMINDVDQMEKHVLQLINGKVVSVSGKIMTIEADTICIHGDHSWSVLFAERLTVLLENLQFAKRSFADTRT